MNTDKINNSNPYASSYNLNRFFYILMFIAIMVSGNPAFISLRGGEKIIFALFTVLLFLVYFSSSNKIPRNSFFIFCAFFLLEIYHWLFLGVPIVTCLGVIMRISCAFFLILIIREKFLRIYCDIMVKLALLSFVFYILILAGIADFFRSAINSVSSFWADDFSIKSIMLVHTFFWKHWWRNSGLFWEPGAFSGYLNLALLFLVSLNRKNSFKSFRKPFWILSIAILTTMSTTGYFSFVIIVLYMLWGRLSTRNFIGVFIGMTIIFFGAVLSYRSLDFLQEKITHQWDAAVCHEGGWQITRIGSVYHDYEYWKEKPLLGWGANLKLRYDSEEDFREYAAKGNGFTDFAVKNGCLGLMILLLIIFILGFKLNGKNKTLALVFTMAVFINLNGEMFLSYPIYLSLLFLGLLPFDEKNSAPLYE